MQSVPQLIPARAGRTEPPPAVVTVSTNVPLPERPNVAVTYRAWDIDTTHAPVPVHAPDHPVNVDPAAGVAVKVTDVPEVYASLQSVPQLMPVGVLVTVPEPDPAFTTDRRRRSPGWCRSRTS